MNSNLSQNAIQGIVQKLNSKLNVALNEEDFRSTNYSVSSLEDILVQKISDELNGEWTTDMAFHKLRNAISKVKGVASSSIHQESDLNAMFPPSSRKEDIKKIGDELGFQVEVLKPNGILYGIFIFLFFACIPVGIGMDWFLAGIVMIVCAVIIFILGKTGNQFRMKTVGHLADHLAWKNYLKQKRNASPADEAMIRKEVQSVIGQ